MGFSADVKIGDPADIAGLVSYLVKPESHFITGALIFDFRTVDPMSSKLRAGQTITIDGGLLFD